MRNWIILAGIASAMALAVAVGNRLSNESVALVVGIGCGISATLPISIGLLFAASHNWGRQNEPEEALQSRDNPRPYAPQPPVVIVTSPQAQMPYGYQQNLQYIPPPMSHPTLDSRDFKIIGGE